MRPWTRVIARCREQGVNPGYPLARDYPEYENGLLVAITERRTRADIDRLADALAGAVKSERERSGGRRMIRAADDELTIYERSKPGRRAFVAPELDVPEQPLDELIPAHLRRETAARLPEVAEPEIVRHYNRLSKRNFDLDTGFYPLGSCTMKHNPKLHERIAALPGHAELHPLQDPRDSQGALEVMWRLQEALGEIAGLPHVSLHPSAGSHGELAGVLLTRAFHEDRGEERTKVLTPDTAHGTNPATVTMAGYDVVKIGTDGRGNVDLDDLRAKADTDVACLMLTNPSTLGLFETGIEEIARIVHGVGATLYYDGANLNAIMGICRPGRHGLRHRPFQSAQDLHPAPRRRWPGRGADRRVGPDRAVSPASPGGPGPSESNGNEAGGHRYDLDYDRPKSIGRLRGFQGNYGVFVRSYAYIRSLGAAGLRDVSDTAVLNANYLLARLRQEGVLELLPAAHERLCMHEFVLSGAPMKRELKIKTLDLAKRLLDHGVHPPTVYFPLHRRRGAAGRADRDRDQGDARPVRRDRGRDPAGGTGGPGDRPRGALHHAGPAPGRGRRCQATCDQAAAVAPMRFVVFGAGAIGGVLGARLHQAGSEVTLIARGPHYEAIRRHGLTLETPDETSVLKIAAVDDPAGIEWRGDEAVLLTMKTQDTAAALAALRALAPATVPVVCVQNAVENERIALRRFANVYGAVVMSPTAHIDPGVVQAFGTKVSGVIDLGRYPEGVDDCAARDRRGDRRLPLRLRRPAPTSCASSTPS